MWWSLLFTALLATTCALNLEGIPTDFTGNDAIMSAITGEIANKFAKEFLAYKKTGVESRALRELSRQLSASHSKKDIFVKNTEDLSMGDQVFVCITCRATVQVFAKMFTEPEGALATEDDAKKAMLEICDYLNIATQEVCAGLFDSNWPYVYYIMLNTHSNSQSFCGTLPISFCQVEQDEFDWAVKISGGSEEVTAHKSQIPSKSESDLRVLQLTDIHYDPEYVPGSLAECDEPMCCQKGTSATVASDKQAGYWSDYRTCDLPLHTIEKSFDHIKKTHTDINYIYQTGDIVPHTVWATSKEGNLEMLTKINNLMVEKFANIPIYSTVGNHEAHPLNVFGYGEDIPEELRPTWLYEHLYTTWSKFLPADTKETILKGGYYTVSPTKGFRIISLNNNDCYLFNWWVFYDGSFGQEQLQWLHDTLLAAEQANEFVHILMHLPSGDADCWTVWAREFNRLVARFHGIIGAIFSGHTHKDEMNVHYTQSGHAVGVNWNGGSLTTYSDKNPNYRVYDVERESMQVVDHESWIFNLTEANIHGSSADPVWYKSFQFSEAFTANLSPAGLHDWLNQLAEKPSLLRKYWKAKMTSADPVLNEGCDEKCLQKTICRLATTVYDQKERCDELKAKLTESLKNDDGQDDDDDKNDDDDDGAATLSAFSVTSMLGIYYLIKFIMQH